jgi:putative ABC transport system permease protein
MNRLLLKTLRDLRNSLAQSIALVVIVMLGVASFAATVAAYRDLDTSYNRTYDDLLFADVTFAVKSAPQSVVDKLLNMEGIEDVFGRLVIDTGLEFPDSEDESPDPIRARLIGLSAPERPGVNNVLVLKGRYFNSLDEAAILLDTHFAEYFNLGPGDTVSPILNGTRIDFPVMGIVASPEYLMVSPSRQEIIPSPRSFGVFFLPIGVLQEKSGMQGLVNDIAIRLEKGSDESAVVESIKEELTPYGLTATTLRADQPSNFGLKADVEEFREIAYLLPTVILLVAAISVYVMLGRQVRAQTPQIGLMKALGYSDKAVMGHFLLYALVIGVFGSVAGALLGLPLGAWITKLYAAELGIPIVEIRFYLDLILEGVVLSLAATILAALAPAYGAARLLPAQAMRFDPAIAQVKGQASLLERIVHLPLMLRLPLRSVFRVRRRSLTTALGIVFAYILILMVWGLLDSLEFFFTENYGVIERWDFSVAFSSTQPPDTREKILEWDGVKVVEPILQAPATLKVGSVNEDILLTAFDPEQEMHILQLPDGTLAKEALADGKLVITTGLAKLLKVSEGDQVTLKTPFGTEEFILGPMTDEMMNTVGYLSMDEAKKRLHAPTVPANGFYLTVDEAQSKQIKGDLYHLPGVVAVQRKADLVSDMRGFMSLFYLLIGIMMAVAVLMAFALLFNAMTVSVLERKREFATMRSIGSGTGRIAALLFTENLILWLVTLLPGLFLGHWMALQVGTSFSAELFTFNIVVSPATYVFTAAGILLTMLLATLPAIRQMNRLNLAEATKVVN